MSNIAFAQTNLNPKLSYALGYAKRGLPIFPTHHIVSGKCSCNGKSPSCKPGKHPRTTHGFKDATTNENQITAWWTQNPDANIALATGTLSGVLVLDVDKKTKGLETLAKWEQAYGVLPLTPCQITGGDGRQFFFKYPQGSGLTIGSGVAPGIDFRGETGYGSSVLKCKPQPIRAFPRPAAVLS